MNKKEKIAPEPVPLFLNDLIEFRENEYSVYGIVTETFNRSIHPYASESCAWYKVYWFNNRTTDLELAECFSRGSYIRYHSSVLYGASTK